jgi:hypothetical protein
MKHQDINAVGRAKYQRLWDVTANVVRTWDPLGLLAGGAPVDEWDHEIASLVVQIPRIRSPVDAAHAVSRIFASSVDPDSFTKEKCSEVGKRLYAALSEQGLIE